MFTSGGTNYNASMVTQDIALSGTKMFVTGVIYNDTVVNDNFFSIGEQTPGRAVSPTGVPTPPGPVAAMSSPSRRAAPRPSASAWRPA